MPRKMCKVYSKELETSLEMEERKTSVNFKRNVLAIKNRNYNTCSGTAFIKPWRTGVKSQQLPGGKQNGQRF